MSAKLLLNYALSIDAGLLLVSLVLLLRSGAHRIVPFFAVFLGTCALQTGLVVAVMYHRRQLQLTPLTASRIYVYSGCAVQLLGAILILLSIYSVYDHLMKPMRGLQRIGRLLFGWVCAVAVCLVGFLVFGPHLVGKSAFATFLGQVQGGVSVLALCLLLAVSFATRPLGLSYRSRIFGITLGLGVLAATTLVEASWATALLADSPYSGVHLISAFGCMAAATIWTVYFARPEPARKVITLPTTSPFFFWNRVAEALGDEPGRVAVSGVTPDMFSPAELIAFASPARSAAPVVEMPHVARR